MKVIIDLIEDAREAIKNSQGFTLSTMGLYEQVSGEFLPSWQSHISKVQIDEKEKKLFFFLGKEAGLELGACLDYLNALSNEEMMYEVCVSYSHDNSRIDSELLGFGESLEDKKYLLFIEDKHVENS